MARKPLGAKKLTKEEREAKMKLVLNNSPVMNQDLPKKVIVQPEPVAEVPVGMVQDPTIDYEYDEEPTPKKVIVEKENNEKTENFTLEPVKKVETRGRKKKIFSEDDIEKARVTHFLSKQNLGDLENMYDDIRRELPYDKKTKIKKSHIVDLAIQTLVADYNKRGPNSTIMKKLFNKI